MADASPISPSANAATADAGSASSSRYFQVRGRVQNVMFRQTVIRAMLKRELSGGATNDKTDKKLVHMTLEGADETIGELMDTIGSGKELNDWGAMATEVMEVDGPTARASQATR